MLEIPIGNTGLSYDCHIMGIKETDRGILVSYRVRPSSVQEEDRKFKYFTPVAKNIHCEKIESNTCGGISERQPFFTIVIFPSYRFGGVSGLTKGIPIDGSNHRKSPGKWRVCKSGIPDKICLGASSKSIKEFDMEMEHTHSGRKQFLRRSGHLINL